MAMKMDKHLQQDGHHEKVVLQKKADHVAISGPYTKKKLRQLLLSSISLLQSDKKVSTELTELESTLKESIGLSQVDLDRITEGKVDEIGEEAGRTLEDLIVTKDTISSAARHEEEDVETVAERRDIEGEGKDLEKSKKSRKSFKELLHERGLSESLVKYILENGLTDEYVRLLKALGFADTEMEQLKMSWQNEIYDSTSLMDSEESCVSSVSSSDDHLSPESLYLKHFLSRVLARALRDIASKKPYDPIEYLGHWLLHLKICEEREKKRKEFEMELMIERERYRMTNVEGQEIEIVQIESGGEEDDEDWNFINYINF